MTRPAQPPLASTFREAEVTGSRPAQRLSSERPRFSSLLMARRCLHEGKPQQAIDILEQELAAGEETRDLQYWLGRAAFQLGDLARAQRALFSRERFVARRLRDEALAGARTLTPW